MEWSAIESTVQEIIKDQQRKTLDFGRRIVPTLTPEDMLQPNDYPELEHHPEFRYNEGLIAGMQTVQMALRALQKEETTVAREQSSGLPQLGQSGSQSP